MTTKQDKEKKTAASPVIATAEELRVAYPELVAAIEDGAPIPEIESIEELEAHYPDIIELAKEHASSQVVAAVGVMTAEQIKLNLPKVFETVAAAVAVAGPAPRSRKEAGFELEFDDPFAAGALRTYCRLKGCGELRLPQVLPYSDRKSKKALDDYILRASGAGDTERVKAAREALGKCK